MVLFGTAWIRLSGSGHNRSRSRMWGLAGSYNTRRVRFHWTSTSLERCERFRHWEISRLGEWRTSQKCHIVSLEFIPKTLSQPGSAVFFWCRLYVVCKLSGFPQWCGWPRAKHLLLPGLLRVAPRDLMHEHCGTIHGTRGTCGSHFFHRGQHCQVARRSTKWSDQTCQRKKAKKQKVKRYQKIPKANKE